MSLSGVFIINFNEHVENFRLWVTIAENKGYFGVLNRNVRMLTLF